MNIPINILQDKTLKLEIQASQECRTQQLHLFNYTERQDCRIKEEEEEKNKNLLKLIAHGNDMIRLQKNKAIA